MTLNPRDISEILAPEDVILDLKAKSKKRVLEQLAALAADHLAKPEHSVLKTLWSRERMGPTAIGGGKPYRMGSCPASMSFMPSTLGCAIRSIPTPSG